MGIITLEIGTPPVEKYFINLHYTKNHPSPDPDTFDLILTPEEVSGIDYFDKVVVKKDGVTEYVGFVEEITPEIGEEGLEYSITGRCHKLILWKKWTERYQESRNVGPEDTEGELEGGFFGQVYPHELIKFILRCPISEHPKGRIRQKIGWGISSDQWDCCASSTAECYYPEWVMLRYSGLAWRNRGLRDETTVFTLKVNDWVNEIDEWKREGVDPYLNAEDASYIHYGTDLPYNAIEKYFKFEHLDPNVVATIDDIYLFIRWFAEAKEAEVYIYLYDGVKYTNLGKFPALGASPGWWSSYPRITTKIRVHEILDTVDKVNNARIYFQKANNLYQGIDYVYLSASCTLVGDPANQRKDDWFVVDLGISWNDVTAALIECRTSLALYARNYKIEWSNVSNACENNYGADDSKWNDFNPPVNVINNTARDILHSWIPEDDVRCLRIQITASADQAWEISQIYIWQSDVYPYRVLDEGD